MRNKPDITNWPRVTRIIQEGGFSDFSRANQAVLARAQVFGRAVHLACLYYDRGSLDIKGIDTNLLPYLEGWWKFKNDNTWAKGEYILAEEQVYSKLYQFKGTPDRIYPGGYLVDIKTGQPNKGWGLQLAAYAQAAKETDRKSVV